jgi:hypothetical protein
VRSHDADARARHRAWQVVGHRGDQTVAASMVARRDLVVIHPAHELCSG